VTDLDANIAATVEFVESVSDCDSLPDPGIRDGFIQGATWSLKRLAAWLETTNIVANDELAQRTVDETKMLIADQARQAAANLRLQK